MTIRTDVIRRAERFWLGTISHVLLLPFGAVHRECLETGNFSWEIPSRTEQNAASESDLFIPIEGSDSVKLFTADWL